MKKSLSSDTMDQEHSSSSNSNQLVERIPIEDTPFTAIKCDNQWFLTMGKYRLTEPMPSLDEVTQDAQRADWTRVMQIIQIMIDENEAKRNNKA